jgi:hypothetical protein
MDMSELRSVAPASVLLTLIIIATVPAFTTPQASGQAQTPNMLSMYRVLTPESALTDSMAIITGRKIEFISMRNFWQRITIHMTISANLQSATRM